MDVPIGKNVPGVGTQVTLPHALAAVGVEYVTAAPHWPGVFETEMSSGQVSAQLATITVTAKEQEASVVFDASFAEQLTAVLPSVKTEPEGGLQVIVARSRHPVAVGAE